MNITFYLKLSTIFFARQHLQSMPSNQCSYWANSLFDGQVVQKVLVLFDAFESHKEGMFLKRQIKGFQLGLHGATKSFVLSFKPFYKKFSRSKMVGFFYGKPIGLSEKLKISAYELRERSFKDYLSTIFQALQFVQAWSNAPLRQIPDYEKSVEAKLKKSEIIMARDERNLKNKKLASIKKLQDRLEANDLNGEKTIEFLEKLEHEMHQVMNQSLQCDASATDEQNMLLMIAYQYFFQKNKSFRFLHNKKKESTCTFFNQKNDFLFENFFKNLTFGNEGFDFFKKDSRPIDNCFIQLNNIETILDLIIEFKSMRFSGGSLQDLQTFIYNLSNFYIYAEQSFNNYKSCFEDRNVIARAVKIYKEFDESMRTMIEDGDNELKKLSILFSEQSKDLSKKINGLLKNIFDGYRVLCIYKANFPEKLELIENMQESYHLANNALVGTMRIFLNVRDFLISNTKFIHDLRRKIFPAMIVLREAICQKYSVLLPAPQIDKALFLSGSQRIYMHGSKLHNDNFCSCFFLLKHLRYNFDPTKWFVCKSEKIYNPSKPKRPDTKLIVLTRRESKRPDEIYDLFACPKVDPFLSQRFLSIYESRDSRKSNIFSISNLSFHNQFDQGFLLESRGIVFYKEYPRTICLRVKAQFV